MTAARLEPILPIITADSSTKLGLFSYYLKGDKIFTKYFF